MLREYSMEKGDALSKKPAGKVSKPVWVLRDSVEGWKCFQCLNRCINAHGCLQPLDSIGRMLHQNVDSTQSKGAIINEYKEH